mgnify:FL=1
MRLDPNRGGEIGAIQTYRAGRNNTDYSRTEERRSISSNGKHSVFKARGTPAKPDSNTGTSAGACVGQVYCIRRKTLTISMGSHWELTQYLIAV